MKRFRAVTLSCVLLGLAAMPALAEQSDGRSNDVRRGSEAGIARATGAAPSLGEPITLRPVTVLPNAAARALVGSCAAQREAGVTSGPFGASVGVFFPTSVPSGITSDVGFSVEVERLFASNGYGDFVGSVRYSRYSVHMAGASGDVNLVNPMVGYRYRLGQARRLYLEPGIGLAFVSGNSAFTGSGTTEFAYSLAGGYDYNNFYLDLRYIAGGSDSERGFIVGLGGHF